MKQFLLLFAVFVVFKSHAQDTSFVYKTVPSAYLPSSTDLSCYHNGVDELIKGAYDLTNSLPSGYVTDGSVNYTSYLNTGLTGHASVVFPDFPVLVTDVGLVVRSNTNVFFKPNSKIILATSHQRTYNIIKISRAQNVSIYFPVIVGDRDTHIDTFAVSQWGMGIDIVSSKNVKIINPKISKCWGDGIYIGKYDTSSAASQNVQIYAAQLDYNRRNGISVVSARDVKISNAIISNTTGNMPMSGIDIEPNNNKDTISNVIIQNTITYNNSMHGIVTSIPSILGAHTHVIGITITNHLDDNSKIGFGLSLTRLVHTPPDVALTGLIQVLNPMWINYKSKGFQNYQSSNPTNTNGVNVLFRHVSMYSTYNDTTKTFDTLGITNMNNSLAFDPKITIEN